VDFAAQADDRTIEPESSTVVMIGCGRLGDMFDTAWGRNTEDITDRAAPCGAVFHSRALSSMLSRTTRPCPPVEDP
jgi:hypothetical protein